MINTLDNIMTTTFVTRLNNDDINHVIGCNMNTLPGGVIGYDCSYVQCQFEKFTQNDAAGVPRTYVRFTSVVNLANPSQTAATNACGFRAVSNVSVLTTAEC